MRHQSLVWDCDVSGKCSGPRGRRLCMGNVVCMNLRQAFLKDQQPTWAPVQQSVDGIIRYAPPLAVLRRRVHFLDSHPPLSFLDAYLLVEVVPRGCSDQTRTSPSMAARELCTPFFQARSPSPSQATQRAFPCTLPSGSAQNRGRRRSCEPTYYHSSRGISGVCGDGRLPTIPRRNMLAYFLSTC